MPNYKEIARLKATGQSNRAIADFLGLSRNTVNADVRVLRRCYNDTYA